MPKQHHYSATITWTGNQGSGTERYNSYNRNHIISIKGKPEIAGSSDPSFLGDPAMHNPEDLLLSSLSSCHMLWYLHLCSKNGISVVSYSDHAIGTIEENDQNGGHFIEVVLNPVVTITDGHLIDKANALHSEANQMCFIANSCNFPVRHVPTCRAEQLEY